MERVTSKLTKAQNETKGARCRELKLGQRIQQEALHGKKQVVGLRIVLGVKKGRLRRPEGGLSRKVENVTNPLKKKQNFGKNKRYETRGKGVTRKKKGGRKRWYERWRVG